MTFSDLNLEQNLVEIEQKPNEDPYPTFVLLTDSDVIVKKIIGIEQKSNQDTNPTFVLLTDFFVLLIW